MELKTFLCMTMFMALPSLYYSKQTPLQSRISSLDDVVHRMEGVINEQSQQIKNLEKVIDEQLKAFQEESKIQLEKITILGEENKNQSIQITNLNFKADDAGAKVDFIPGTYMRGASGCLSDTITLTCPAGQTILMDKAEYGEYSRGCESTCCTPHPYDCVESMETSNPNEWLTLQLECDNKESCTYLFQGSTFVGACTIANAVDYVHLFYTCLPVSSSEPIGFTAFNSYDDQCDKDDLVKFDGIITNLGNYYNSISGIFICPLNGVYLFGIDILTPYEKLMSAQLMKDNTVISRAFANNIASAYTHASSTVIIECNRGQQIWVKCERDGSLSGTDTKDSIFFGYLLYSI